MTRSLGWCSVLAVALALPLSACTDVCDQAIEELHVRCDREVARDPGEMCEGEQKAVSQCIVDFPQAACDYYYDPVAEADNAFARCLERIGGP